MLSSSDTACCGPNRLLWPWALAENVLVTIPVIIGSHLLPEISVNMSEKDRRSRARAAELWGSAEGGPSLTGWQGSLGAVIGIWADGLAWHWTPDEGQVRGLLLTHPQQRADLVLITRLPGLLGGAGPAFPTRLELLLA